MAGICAFVVVLLSTAPACMGDEAALLDLVRKATEGDERAYHAVLRQYGKYQELVGAKRIPKQYAEVLDNRIWSDCMDACGDVKRRYGPLLDRVELPGSAGYRLEPGSRYVVGRSDLDLKIEGAAAEAAAEDLEQALRRKYGGVDPRQLGVNPLDRVDPRSHESLMRAQAHPEKYCTPGGLKALEYEHFQKGVAIVWDETGRARRVSLVELYREKGWPPPPKPTALDAFEGVADQQKFLNASVQQGLDSEARARHDAKYHIRSIDKAGYAGVDLQGQHGSLIQEMEAVARTKNVRVALQERISHCGGNFDVALQQYLRETQSFQRQLATETFQRHCQLIAEAKKQGGAMALEAAGAEKNLQYALAAISKKQAQSLLATAEGTALSATQSSQLLSRSSAMRVEAAVIAERAKIDASRVAGFHQALANELKLSAAERDILGKNLDLLSRSAGGRRLLNSMMDYARKHPVKSGLLAVAICHDIKEVAQTAGAEGLGQGSLLAGNKAADWLLMTASPHYSTARLAELAGRMTFEAVFLNPMKEFAAQRAYEGAIGFLGSLNLDRGELTRRYGLHNEDQVVKEAGEWYDAWMAGRGEALGMRTEIRAGGPEKINEVREAFIRQAREDYRHSQWLQMARDYSYDAKTGEYGQDGFFAQVGGGQITFENFALRFPNEEKARFAIEFYLWEKWTYDWDKYKGEVTERDAREDFLRKYLFELWKLSAAYNRKLEQAKEEAQKQIEEARAIGADPQQQAEWRENVIRDFYIDFYNRQVDLLWEQAATSPDELVERESPPVVEQPSKPPVEFPPPPMEPPLPPRLVRPPLVEPAAPPAPDRVPIERIWAALPAPGSISRAEFDLDYSEERDDSGDDPQHLRLIREWSGYRELICQDQRGPALAMDLLMIQVVVTYTLKGNPKSETPEAFRNHVVQTADEHLRGPYKYKAKTPMDTLPGAVLCTRRWQEEGRKGANYDVFVWQSPRCHLAVKCSFYVTDRYSCSPSNTARFDELDGFVSTVSRRLAGQIHTQLQQIDAEPPNR
jgi:hypothetical protein